jgi:hypothetical protein
MLLTLARGTIALVVLALASPANADELFPVKVQLPFGMQAASITTSAVAGDESSKYVTIESLLLANPSRSLSQPYEPSQFHLLVGSKSYRPVVRPHLNALDISEPTMIVAAQSQRVTVTFEVPSVTTAAKFEFLPHWQSDDSGPVDYCCLYL